MRGTFPFKRISVASHWPITPLGSAIERVQALERAGFTGVWAGEGAAGSDPFAVTALYANQTSRLQVGTAIASWTRSPVTMAASAATVDAISDGRFILGLGATPKQWSAEWHNIDATRAVGRMKEYIEAIRVSWAAHSGREANFEGEFYRIRGFSRGSKPLREAIPIYLAVAMPGMTRLAGGIADGVIFHFIHTLKYLREVSIPALSGGAQRTGRTLNDIAIVPSVLCYVSNDRQEATQWVKARILSYLPHHYINPIFDLHGFQQQREIAMARLQAGDKLGAIAAIPDELAGLVAVIGTRDECRRKLREYAEFTDSVRLHIHDSGTPASLAEDQFREVMETFGGN